MKTKRKGKVGLLLLCVPVIAFGQAASPFMTGATALQTNILAWLTPIAIILVMALGAMAMANRLVENCGNTLILRCSGSENGGTSRFASGLIGEREVLRTAISRSRRATEILPSVTRAEHLSVESAVMSSEIEQLPDLAGYLKLASRREWLRASLQPQLLDHPIRSASSRPRSSRIRSLLPGMHPPRAASVQQADSLDSKHAHDGFDISA